jgi:DNA-binding NtrC family response regulator
MNYGVLFISPRQEDAAMLASMLAPVSLRLDHVPNLETARARLGQGSYGAVLTEAELPDGNWTDTLDLAYGAHSYPAVIVTHRLADDRFWAEVLNLGAYDLLAQPFDRGEVQRILHNACSQAPAKPVSQAPGRAQPLRASR